MNIKYSTDDEEFIYDSVGEMLDDSPLEVGDTYYSIEAKPLEPSDLITKSAIMHLLENLDECAYYEVGEVFENHCADASIESQLELQSMIQGWAAKHLKLSDYFLIKGKSAEMKVQQEDLQ